MNSDFPFGSLPSFDEIEQASSFNARSNYSLMPEQFMVDESLIDRDCLYMRQLCPGPLQALLNQIEDICDRLEYEGSFLYDEAPDQTTIKKLISDLMAHHKEDVEIEKKDLIGMLLLDEILFRRQRYYRKKKLFQ